MSIILLAAESDSHFWRTAAYAGFVVIILAMLALDLGVFRRTPRVLSFKAAAGWASLWISVALLFNVAVYFLYEAHVFDLGLDVPVLGAPGRTETVSGAEAARLFLAAYLLEESLSMDNLLVIAVIFTSMRIPLGDQHRVLFWGILGAMVMRGVMIAVGVAMIERISWIVYVFGGLLIVTAIRMALMRSDDTGPPGGFFVRLLRRFANVTDDLHGQRFFVRLDGRLFITPLFVALMMIEFADVMFAIDSIPAVFAITADPFIVFTSNIMAILGLRSLYFCLATVIVRFRYLKPALIIVLLYAGIKMCLVHTVHIPTVVSLAVIAGVLGIGIIASVIAAALKRGEDSAAAAQDSGSDAS